MIRARKVKMESAVVGFRRKSLRMYGLVRVPSLAGAKRFKDISHPDLAEVKTNIAPIPNALSVTVKVCGLIFNIYSIQ
jgi:hypothetical protein